ncbi:MAG: TatD family hydrolase [Clostridium sp.]|nr:TatD family hydrolase [Clostridium sp.]
MTYLDVHTHNLMAGPLAIINLPFGAEIPSEGAFSMGIHPWDTEGATEKDFETLAERARDSRIAAIGECGLDALRGGPLERQEEIFLRQAALSEEVGKPLIIHAVRTHGRIAQLRRALKPRQRWIVHGFRGKPQLARQLLDAGCDISLGERFNPDVPGIVPAGRLFAETDCSEKPISEIREAIGLAQFSATKL